MAPMDQTLEQTERPRLSRRDFFVRTAGGFALGFMLTELTRVEQVEAAGGATVTTWLSIDASSTVFLTIGASEMGQGSASGLAQVLAEELMVDFNRVSIVQGAPTMTTPAPIGSAINTVGSGMIRNNFWKMRDAGAMARQLLLEVAMSKTGDLDPSHYTIAGGAITWNGSTTFSYGQLWPDAALIGAPQGAAALVPDSQFRLIGKTQARADIPSKVTGAAQYGIDIRLPNMVYAVVRHSPSLGGTLAATPAKPSGSIALVPLKVYPGTGTNRGLEASGNINAFAVVGTNTWDTWQAAKKVSAKWTLPANAASLNSAQFMTTAVALTQNATPYTVGGANAAPTLYTVEGDAATATNAIAGATAKIDSTYKLPYVAHACMEVLNCTVDYVPGVRCDVYAPTQSAKAIIPLVNVITGLPYTAINVHTTYLGGGLGRKAEADFVSQAVQVAVALAATSPRPVKLMWPREEDFTHDQYRPMAAVRVRAGVNSAGNVLGWAARNVSPSILAQRGSTLPAKGDSQGYEGLNDLPYNFLSRATEYVSHPSPIPVGFWRSVGASINTFVTECAVDELAFASGQDPYLYRRNLLTSSAHPNAARWVAVLDAAAALAGWSAPPPAGSFRGIAIGTAFGSIVAEVVEISGVTSTGLKVNKVSIAMDCYLTVNPGQVEAQLTGGMVHGLNAALFGKQVFTNGAAQNKNFTNNRMIRLSEMPAVKVTLLPNPSVADRGKIIGGAGELGVPTLAPALANAWFKATGTRKYELPFFPTATMGGL